MEEMVTIESLDHYGRGIAHLNHKVIFVEHALPKEIVKIKIEKSKKNFMEAKILEIIQSSDNRVISKCPYFEKCGGCDLLHLTYQKQLEYKQNKVKEIMKKFASLEHVVKPIIPNDSILEYRNKVTFQVDQKIGFYQKRSSSIIEIDRCLLISEKMNEVLSFIKKNVDLSYVNQIMIRESLHNIMVVLKVKEPFQKKQIKSFKNEFSLMIQKNNTYELIHGNSFIEEKIGDFIFKISPESFFQVNTKQMEKLYQIVLDKSGLTGKENVLDLYCGTGTIGIFVSKRAKQVLGIEINKQAIEDAIWNKQRNKIENIEFLCGDTGSILKKNSFQPDLVIVDPPRAGLDLLALDQLKKIHVSKLIYVSCDPVTLARDIKLLQEFYSVESITPVDMFSNTYHVECVCVLNRK